MNIKLTESQIKVILESIDFTTLYRENYQPIFNQVCLRMADGDRDLAKDFCQVGFLKVYQNLDKYSGIGNLQGWVRRVVKNEVINELRKRKLETTDTDISKLNVEIEPTEKDFMGGQITKEQLRKAIDKLPEGYKTVLVLYYFGELNHNEIASVLNIDPGTSRSQISKAKSALRKSLEGYLDLPSSNS
jgi:RNA polymerase sigma-70 factor (ECF subfamily)